MTIGVTPVCIGCQHLRKGASCVAFPGGIPEAIWLGGFTHTVDYPGDGGIHFLAQPGYEVEADRSVSGPDSLHWEAPDATRS